MSSLHPADGIVTSTGRCSITAHNSEGLDHEHSTESREGIGDTVLVDAAQSLIALGPPQPSCSSKAPRTDNSPSLSMEENPTVLAQEVRREADVKDNIYPIESSMGITNSTTVQVQENKTSSQACGATSAPKGTANNPIIVDGNSNWKAEIPRPLEQVAKDERKELEETRRLSMSLVHKYNTTNEAGTIIRKRTYKSYRYSLQRNDRADPRSYLAEQEAWLGEMSDSCRDLMSHLQKRRKVLRSALGLGEPVQVVVETV